MRKGIPASKAAGGSDHKHLNKCKASDCPSGCAADAVPASRAHPLLAVVVPVLVAVMGLGTLPRLCRVPQVGHEVAAAGVQSACPSFHLPNFDLGVGFSIFSVCLEKWECFFIAARYLQLQLRIKCRKIDFLST